MDYASHPTSEPALNHLASAIDAFLRRRLPSGKLVGRLEGREAEIRQNTEILLFRRYLDGNAELRIATATGNKKEVTNQLQRSIFGALNVCWLLINRHLEKLEKLEAPLPSEEACGSCDHPSNLPDSDLTLSEQKRLALAFLEEGVKQMKISKENAEIAKDILTTGISQVEIAAKMKISKQAVHQRVAPVQKFLRKKIKERELTI